MKLSGARFSVPHCILRDNLPDKAFRLLVYLFSISDIAGCATADYDELKIGADITSRSTIAASIKLLKKHGWFHFVKKGGGKRAVYWLRIPPRFSETDHSHPAIRMSEISCPQSVPTAPAALAAALADDRDASALGMAQLIRRTVDAHRDAVLPLEDAASLASLAKAHATVHRTDRPGGAVQVNVHVGNPYETRPEPPTLDNSI